LLNAWGLFDFWNWLHNGAGEKTVDILIRIALILFFSAVGWTLLARPDREPSGFRYSRQAAAERAPARC
jgi:hypothetical protein